MKRIKLSLILALAFSFSLYGQMKNTTNLTFSLTPLEKDEGDDISFGGSYLLAESTMKDDYVTLGGKLYYRLNGTDSAESEAQKLDVKRAYGKIRPFGNSVFEIAIGKLYSYYLDGAYFALTETYTGASRWGESGLGVKSQYSGFTFGLALPLTESYVNFTDNWGLNASLSYDFSNLNEGLPLTLGVNLLYSATADGDSDVSSVSEKDFAQCFALYYSKKNLSFFKNFALFFAYSHNARPYVAHTVLSPVEVIKKSSSSQNKNLKQSDLFSLAIRPVIGKVKITSESEIGHSGEGDIIPFYTALQFNFPVTQIFSLKPMAGYYGAFDRENSSNSYDCWEIYPKLVFDVSRFTFTAGWDFFCKEFADGDYKWVWEIPLTAKVKIGE
ncbi:MAG: hypothetical protein K5873_01285 [Treponema sp.]|nr:hypothetical protein [Treponema sp.]